MNTSTKVWLLIVAGCLAFWALALWGLSKAGEALFP